MSGIRSGEQGFSLIETLIALAIIAGVTGMVYRTLSGTAQIGAGMAARREAILIAQSALAAATSPGSGHFGQEGQSGALAWRVDVQPFAQNAREDGPPVEQVSVTVRARATGQPLARLTTLRLAR